MVLVFILLGILIILLTLTFIILISTLHIEIKDLEATNIRINDKQENKKSILKNRNSDEKTNTGYAIILSLYLGNKIRWISIHLNDEKLRKMYSKMQLEKIDIKKLEKDFKWEDLKIVKRLKPKISYFNLNAILGTETPTVTAFLVAFFSSVISISLPYLIVEKKIENYKYTIQPVYKNQNIYKIQFNCIIQVKMVHIINVILLILKNHILKKGN